MSKTKKLKIDIDKIIKNNPNVDASDLCRNLKVIREVQENGVNVGPNYNLGSPYSRPYQRSDETGLSSRSKAPKKI